MGKMVTSLVVGRQLRFELFFTIVNYIIIDAFEVFGVPGDPDETRTPRRK